MIIHSIVVSFHVKTQSCRKSQEIGIVWAENQLSGTIPTEIAKVLALSTLSLDDNELSGPIPSQLGLLTDLTWLSVRQNQLSGTF